MDGRRGKRSLKMIRRDTVKRRRTGLISKQLFPWRGYVGNSSLGPPWLGLFAKFRFDWPVSRKKLGQLRTVSTHIAGPGISCDGLQNHRRPVIDFETFFSFYRANQSSRQHHQSPRVTGSFQSQWRLRRSLRRTLTGMISIETDLVTGCPSNGLLGWN